MHSVFISFAITYEFVCKIIQLIIFLVRGLNQDVTNNILFNEIMLNDKEYFYL